MRVVVQSLAGQTLEFELDSETKVSALKSSIASCCDIPPACQNLLNGTNLLHDSACLSDCAQSGVPEPQLLSLSLIVSHAALRQALIDGDTCEKESALATLVKLGPKGGEESVIDVVVGGLEDTSRRIRSSALTALTQLACKGHDHATQALLPRLKHPNYEVRCMAVQALGQIADVGDKRALHALIECLGDVSGGVRSAGAQALPQVAQKGDSAALAALVACLHDEDRHVRSTAMEVLPKVAQKGNLSVMAEVVSSLQNKEVDGHLALKALTNVVEKGDARAISALTMCLEEACPTLRVEVLEALTQIAEQGANSVLSCHVWRMRMWL